MKQREIKQEFELLEALKRDDSRATETLYKMHYQPVLHFVMSNSGTEDNAREIYQQSFIILYEKLLKPDFVLRSSAGTFLFAVSKNLWLASLKEKRRTVTSEMDNIALIIGEDARSWDAVLAREHEFEVMYTALDKLGEPCCQLLKGFYLNQKSMEELAQEMGYNNADSAKNQKYKCLQRLKKMVSEKLPLFKSS